MSSRSGGSGDPPFGEAGAFEALMDAVPEGVAVLSESGFVYANDTLCTILGLDAGDLIDRSPLDLVHPDDRPGAEEHMVRVRSEGTADPDSCRFRTADGQWIQMEIGSRMWEAYDSRLIICVFRDVTGRVELEAQLRQAQKMETVGELTGAIAHDFNNLLTGILGALGGALSTLEDDSPLRPELGDAWESARRAAGLTRQLLAFSRKSRSQPRVLDLGARLDELHSLLERLVGARVELVLEPPPEPLWVRIDPSYLEQVVVNLVVNARDAMPEGGRVRISVNRVTPSDGDLRKREEPTPGPHVVFSVEDDGVGIPAAERPLIFEPFFTTKSSGTGLGLATVQGIVAGAEGFVRVESGPESGSTFQVYLPEVAPGEGGESRDARPLGASSGVVSPTGPAPAEKVRILVVEDEDVIRRVVRRALEKRGYSVQTASGGKDAMAFLGRSPDFVPDILVTDVVLGDMNGPEVAREVLGRFPGTPVLFTSGYSDEMVLESVDDQEGYRFALLEKPFSMERLLEEVLVLLSPPRNDGAERDLRAPG